MKPSFAEKLYVYRNLKNYKYFLQGIVLIYSNFISKKFERTDRAVELFINYYQFASLSFVDSNVLKLDEIFFFPRFGEIILHLER